MNESVLSLTSLRLDCRDSNFSEDDSPVRCGSTTNQNQVILDVKIRQFFVRQAMSLPPHLRLMLIPVLTGFFNFKLDFVEDCIVCLDRVWVRFVGLVEGYLFFRCYNVVDLLEFLFISWRYAISLPIIVDCKLKCCWL